MGMEQGQGSRAGWRAWYSPVAAVVVAAIVVAAAYFEEAMVGYQIWRYGAPGIAPGATEDARLAAPLFWPLASAICADPTLSATQLAERYASRFGIPWQSFYDLVAWSDSTEVHQRNLWPYRFPGLVLQSTTVDGALDSVEVRFQQIEPTDGHGPSNYAVYDEDCRLVGASLFELETQPRSPWRWNRTCFGPGWIQSDCDAMEDRFVALADMSDRPLENVEIQCFGGGISPFAECPSYIQRVVPPIGHVDYYFPDR